MSCPDFIMNSRHLAKGFLKKIFQRFVVGIAVNIGCNVQIVFVEGLETLLFLFMQNNKHLYSCFETNYSCDSTTSIAQQRKWYIWSQNPN